MMKTNFSTLCHNNINLFIVTALIEWPLEAETAYCMFNRCFCLLTINSFGINLIISMIRSAQKQNVDCRKLFYFESGDGRTFPALLFRITQSLLAGHSVSVLCCFLHPSVNVCLSLYLFALKALQVWAQTMDSMRGKKKEGQTKDKEKYLD